MRKYLQTAILCAFCLISGCAGGNIEADNTTGILPGCPGEVISKARTESSLTFSWSPAEGAQEYGWKLLKGMTLVKNGVCSDTEVTVTGLESGTKYNFAVRGLNGDKSSAYSQNVEASTTASGDPSEGGDDEDPVETPDPVADVYQAIKMPSAEDEDDLVRAFPGAEGGGMFTTGGRGGAVYHVTTLEDVSTQGSLRWAVSQKGARTIVFDVAGTITLKSPLEIKNGDLTIAGQTAPGDGICIKGRYTKINADNVIIRFVRFRLGDEGSGLSDSDDAIWARYRKNIIVDHCSMSWCIDECASFYANSYFTMQWCFIAESMRSSVHSKGDHGYGGIWGGSNASFHHNLLAHHDSRNPRFDHPHIYENHNTVPNRGVIDYRNNVVYNWGSNSSYGGEGYGSGKGEGINMVGNLYKPGKNSTDRKYFIDSYAVYAKCDNCGTNIDEGYPLVYMDGNVHTKYSDITSDNPSGIYWHNKDGHANYGVTSPKAFAVKGPDGQVCKVTTHGAREAFDAVCGFGGASLSRDRVDQRTADDAKNGTGEIIDCVTTTDGKVSVNSKYGYTWPLLSATDRQKKIASTDSDGDGIPDYYEALFGLDPKNPDDAKAKTLDTKGRYTNLEMYLHYLVRDVVEAGNKGGTYGSLQ
ncbi:MAG: fibronectin type III domain-containing protein [Candidatus Cryptobacteroides sp.]